MRTTRKHIRLPKQARQLLFCTVAASAISSVAGVIIRQKMSSFLNQDMQFRNLWFWVVVLIAAGMYVLTAMLLPFLQRKTGLAITASTYGKIQTEILGMDVSDPKHGGTGEISTLLTRDVRNIERFVGRVTVRFIPDSLSWLATCCILATISPWLFVSAIAVSAIPIAAMFFWSKSIRTGNEYYLKESDRVNQLNDEVFRHLELIKARQTKQHHLYQIKNAHIHLHRTKFHLTLRESLFSIPSLFFSFGMAITLAVSAGYLYSLGSIDLADTALVILLTDYIVNPVMAFDNTVVAFRQAQASRKRLDGYMPDTDVKEEYTWPQSNGETGIAISDVTFSYPEKQPIISNYSRVLLPGQPWYLLGENGTGKSTLIYLLSGIYYPQKGSIRIYGIDTRVPYNNSENMVCVCTQDMFLFQDTVMGNLTGGCSVPTEKVYRVCKEIGIHEEICSLPQGYNTVLGENGSPLSRGQRQRLCICRTLLKEGSVYIFDEPTAALDQAHSKLVMEKLDEYAKDRLVILISHDVNQITSDNVLHTKEFQ